MPLHYLSTSLLFPSYWIGLDFNMSNILRMQWSIQANALKLYFEHNKKKFTCNNSTLWSLFTKGIRLFFQWSDPLKMVTVSIYVCAHIPTLDIYVCAHIPMQDMYVSAHPSMQDIYACLYVCQLRSSLRKQVFIKSSVCQGPQKTHDVCLLIPGHLGMSLMELCTPNWEKWGVAMVKGEE